MTKEQNLTPHVAGLAHQGYVPDKCPITRRPFFTMLEHPDLGLVPTYGGPYDSYTIPYMEGQADQPFHERELAVHHYDHDRGSWVDDETIPLRVIHDDVLNEYFDLKEASQAKQPAQQATATAVKDFQGDLMQTALAGKFGNVLGPFLVFMDQELHANAGKGDRSGWLSMSREQALQEINHHLAKLKKAVQNDDIALIVEHSTGCRRLALPSGDLWNTVL